MSLRLGERIFTLLRADAHGVVEALEERSLLLKQSLREAELELLEKRARLAALAEEEARGRSRAERCRAEIAALDEDVALALAGDREELARFAIRRLLPLRREVAGLEREGTSLAAAQAALAEQIERQQAEFEELRERVRTRLARASCTSLRDDETFGPPPVDEAEVELELLRRRGATRVETPR
jgi:phage shock protein A